MDLIESNDKAPALSIARTRFEIILADEIGAPLAMVSPPLDDISEMIELERNAFSLKEHISGKPLFLQGLREHLDRLLSKNERFSDSATFFNRVANFHGALSEFDLEARAAESVSSLANEAWARRKLGESRLLNNRVNEAQVIFRDLADNKDPESALRLASFEVGRGNLGEALRWVEVAVDMNPEGYSERLFQGALHLLKGSFESAVGYFRIALDERPNSSAAYCNLGMAYLGLGRPDKAFEALKRSVAMEPFNQSAILALADVAAAVGKDSDAVNSLRYFVEFEQKESAVWGRLARCLLNLKLVDDCIVALKAQGSLSNSPMVWNNLGVAYAIANQKKASMQALKFALNVENGEDPRAGLLIARNIIQLVASVGEHESVKKIAEDLIRQDTSGELLRDPVLSDIYSFYVVSLHQLGDESGALRVSEDLLGMEGLAPELTKWLVSSIVGARSIEHSDDGFVAHLIEKFSDFRLEKGPRALRLLNNFAFALAELGRLEDADKCVQQVSNFVHHDAYLTATLGLINFRKGNISRGEELYREAIILARSAKDKARIRQKLFFELGKLWLDKSGPKARKFLEKASGEKQGESAIRRQARSMIKNL